MANTICAVESLAYVICRDLTKKNHLKKVQQTRQSLVQHKAEKNESEIKQNNNRIIKYIIRVIPTFCKTI